MTAAHVVLPSHSPHESEWVGPVTPLRPVQQDKCVFTEDESGDCGSSCLKGRVWYLVHLVELDALGLITYCLLVVDISQQLL